MTEHGMVDPLERLFGLQARYISGGIPIGDIQEARKQTQSLDDWPSVWSALASTHETRGDTARSAGRHLTATTEYLQAAAEFQFGWYLFFADFSAYLDGIGRASDCYAKAIRVEENPFARRFSFSLEEGEFFGFLRTPEPDWKGPIALLIPGLDATAVELHGLSEQLLARRVATYAFDGPGQGVNRAFSRIEPRYERVVTTVLDALEGAGFVGPAGLLGVSLGGYYAPRAAAFEPRVRASVAVCGPYRFGPVARSVRQSPLQLEAMRRGFGADDVEGTLEAAAQMDLEGISSQIASPLLVVHAANDVVVPGSEGAQLAATTPGADLVMYPTADHVCHNIFATFRAESTDWLAEKLHAV